MRNGFIFFAFTFLLTQGYSQVKKLSVNYDFRNNSTDVSYTRETNLTADMNMSLFTIFKTNDQEKKVVSDSNLENDSDQAISTIIMVPEKKDIYVFRNLSSVKLIHSTSRNNIDYKVEESLPDFNWQLHNEEKLINGLTAKKATTNFRGRHYTAWYIPSIPLPYGPWKFGGLPGLIADVYDDFYTFRWSASSIKYPYQGNLALTEPTWSNYKCLTIRELVELDEKEDAEYFAKLRAKLPKGARLVNSSASRGGIELIYEWETK